MSEHHPPRRLLDYGDRVDGVLQRALRAEQSGGALPGDDVHLAAAERRLAALLEGTPGAPQVPRSAPGAHSVVAIAGAALIAVVALTLFASSGVGSDRRTAAPATPDASAALVAPTWTAPPSAAPSFEPEVPTVAATALPDAPSPPRRLTGAGASSPTASSDAEELALIDTAQRLLHRDPAGALQTVNGHERRFPNGVYTQEREAIAIEALLATGATREASRRWRVFETRFPGSSHRVRLAPRFSSSP